MQVFQRRLIDAAQQQASLQDIILKNKTRTGQTPTMVQNYTYVGDFSSVTAGGTAQTNVPIQGDSDFIMVYMSGLVYDSSSLNVITSPYAKLQITDNSSQRSMFSNPVYFSLVMGNAGFPYILQEPRLVTANTQLVLTLNNLQATGSINAECCFSGYRVYY